MGYDIASQTLTPFATSKQSTTYVPNILPKKENSKSVENNRYRYRNEINEKASNRKAYSKLDRVIRIMTSNG